MATLTRNITKGTNPMGKAEILLRLSTYSGTYSGRYPFTQS